MVIKVGFSARAALWFSAMALLWLVGCIPAEPIQVTRVVAVTMTATAAPTHTPTLLTPPSAVRVETIPIPTHRPTTVLIEQTRVLATPSPTWNQPVIEGQLPPITHDLLFRSDGALKLWHHEQGEFEVLFTSEAISQTIANELFRPGQLDSYGVSKDRQYVIANRIVLEEPPTYDIFWLNRISGESGVVAIDVPYLGQETLSPDNRYFVYRSGELLENANSMNQPRSGAIYLKKLEEETEPEQIGYCAADRYGEFGCTPILWTPDGQQLIWGDVAGLWLYDLETAEPRLILTNDFRLSVETYDYYIPMDWSPSGRYLRLFVSHPNSSTQAVLDIQTEQVYGIPHAGGYYEAPAYTDATWLPDDTLFVGWGGWALGEFEEWGDWKHDDLQLATFRVVPGLSLLVMEQSSILPGTAQHYLDDFAVLEGGSLAYSLVPFEGAGEEIAGLYILDSVTATPRKVIQLPARVWRNQNVRWSPDGSGAFFTWFEDGSYRIFYAPAGAGVYYDVKPLLGEFANMFSFTWVP
jgi:hypothetical protein